MVPDGDGRWPSRLSLPAPEIDPANEGVEVKRQITIGICALALLAIGGGGASSASAAAPEFGRCVKKATKGGEGYSKAGCTAKVSTGAKYEWQPGPGTNPKFTSTTRAVPTKPRNYCEKGLEEAKIAEADRQKAKEAEERGEPVLAEKYIKEAEEHEAKAKANFGKAKLTELQCKELVESSNGYEPAAELETKSGELVKCAELSSDGEYTGTKTIGDLTATFSGCEYKGVACHSAGAAEGTIVTSTLDGELGITSTETKEGKTTIKTAGIALSPATGSVVSEFTCGGTAVTVAGSAIREVETDKMLVDENEEFEQSKGVQTPDRFVEEAPDVLESTFGSSEPLQSGLTTRGEVVNEEAIEVNRVV